MCALSLLIKDTLRDTEHSSLHPPYNPKQLSIYISGGITPTGNNKYLEVDISPGDEMPLEV